MTLCVIEAHLIFLQSSVVSVIGMLASERRRRRGGRTGSVVGEGLVLSDELLKSSGVALSSDSGIVATGAESGAEGVPGGEGHCGEWIF